MAFSAILDDPSGFETILSTSWVVFGQGVGFELVLGGISVSFTGLLEHFSRRILWNHEGSLRIFQLLVRLLNISVGF